MLTTTPKTPAREAAMDWIDANQLGRRNLSPDAFQLLLGRRYNRTKKQGARTDLTSGQNVLKLQPDPTTAEKLAEQYGVNEKTVKRAGKFADEVARAIRLVAESGLDPISAKEAAP